MRTLSFPTSLRADLHAVAAGLLPDVQRCPSLLYAALQRVDAIRAWETLCLKQSGPLHGTPRRRTAVLHGVALILCLLDEIGARLDAEVSPSGADRGHQAPARAWTAVTAMERVRVHAAAVAQEQRKPLESASFTAASYAFERSHSADAFLAEFGRASILATQGSGM